MFTRLFFTKVARAASRNVASWAFVGRADTSTPFSYAPKISRANRSSFFIALSSSKIISCRRPAWDNGLHKVIGFLFDRRDKKNIVAIGYNEHNLTWVSPLVRVNQNVLQAVFLNRSNDFFKGYAAPNVQPFILIRIPPEWLHRGIILARCAFCHPPCTTMTTSNVAKFPPNAAGAAAYFGQHLSTAYLRL